MVRRITLRSPLSPVALANKLKDALGGEKATPKAGVCGHGTDQDMMLFVYRPNFQNSFATSLTATMDADESGTRIDGKIGSPGSARVFMWIWFGFLAFFIIAGGSAMIASGQSPVANAPFFLIPLGMMAFGWGLWRLGTWNDAKDSAAILKFLADTVRAREA